MEAFSLNGAVSSGSRYKTGLYAGQWCTIFAVECGGGESLCKDKTYQCDNCFYIWKSGAAFDKIKALRR